ncbi:DUF4011 domain-containing protein [Arthrobacter sp. zg-Y1116]|uniref:DUF4011 domain-containing protein n=1 Tax=Arthrobacter sp. zg-Y1116 TaxID=2964611 RepID=UPI002103084D|nr:DUF4011 domain-containing protein [Arthrobacter sp. zg-Y1116]MCQ1947573.1 DUF3320 domain-containing protein [Arthrobacter sp. zg-Y1116]
MALSNREFIGRTLEILSKVLEPYIDRAMAEVSPGVDWPSLLSRKDELAGRGLKTYKASDVQTQLRMLTERLGNLGYPFALPPEASAYASELRQIRNLWAHNEPFSDDDVVRAIDTALRLMRWMRLDKQAEEGQQLLKDFRENSAAAPLPDPPAPVPAAPRPRAAVPRLAPVPLFLDTEAVSPPPAPKVEAQQGTTITLETASEVSYAMSYNGGQVINRLVVANPGPEIRGAVLQLSLTAEIGVVSRTSEHYLDIPAGGSITLSSPNLQGDPAAMLQLEDRQQGTVRAELKVENDVVASASRDVELLGAQHWKLRRGLLALESLAAFVQPNHPEIAKLCSEASDLLKAETGNSALNGYQSGSERADAIAWAIFRAVQSRGIRYSEPAPSWGQHAQRIRTPEQVLSGQFGTCMDTTVILAAALEFAGLQANLWLMDGHIFVGYWRDERNFQTPALEEAAYLVNEVDLGNIRLMESTMVTDGGETFRPQDVHDAAYKRYLTGEMDEVRGVVDIFGARSAGIRPIPARLTNVGGKVEVYEYTPPRPEMPSVPQGSGRGSKSRADAKQLPPRISQWKNALLDLSLRNRLINFTKTARFPLAVPDSWIGQFEDLISAGTPITLAASDDVAAMQRERGVRYGRDLPQEQLADMLVKRHAVFADVTEAGYQSRMRSLAYKARTLIEETGANNLYLALGSLVWSLDGKELRSPLVLVPVQLRPTSKQGPYEVVLDETGGSTPNYCLLEKLRMEHGMEIPGLADPEEDHSGIDLDAALGAVRSAVQAKGLPFRVEPTVDLSILQFAKFRLWKDLDEHWEELSKNPLVRHLVSTPTDPFTDPATTETGEDLDELAARVPIPADSSQLQAISEAVAGKTFVLEGPPGTGKSQTITNLLTRAVADGKRVLFVAEKRAALEVVQKRLDDVGMGVFALDLHDKGSKPAAVREQIRRALDHHADPDRQGLDAAVSELNKARRGLVRYAARLHDENNAELSLYSARTKELAVGDEAEPLSVPESFVEKTSIDQLQQLRSLLAELPDVADPAAPGDRTPWGFITRPLTKAKAEAASDAARRFQAALDRTTADPEFARVVESARTVADLGKLREVLSAGTLDLDLLDEVASRRWNNAIDGLGNHVTAFIGAAHPGLDKVVPEAIDLPVADLHAQAVAAAESGFFGRKKRLIAVRDQLANYIRPGVVVKPKDVPALTEALLTVQSAARGLACEAASVPGVRLPESWNPLTEAGQHMLRHSVDWLRWASDLVKVTGRPGDQTFLQIIRTYLRKAGQVPEGVGRTAADLAQAAADLFNAAGVGPRDLEAWLGGATLLDRWTQTSRGRDVERPGLPSLARWLDFMKALEPLNVAGLGAARGQLKSGTIPADDAVGAFERGLALAAQSERSAATGLDRFEARSHEKMIERFITRSAAIRQQLKAAVPAEVLAQRSFNPQSEAGQMGKLHRQLGSKRGMKVRPLLENFGELITRITPCVLVSPDSVARFFPARSDLFDLVVFDEASQIRVADAVGAMGRGRSVVVVGDSKQMPPTSFAETSLDRDDEEDDAADTVADEESILSECVSARVPRQWLTWHYRSQDESLIAFSNQQYYDSKLSSFPAPVHGSASADVKGYGVNFIRVTGGHFNRTGKGKLLRTNPVEAEAVVAEIRRRFLASPQVYPSVGVVTFNLQQRAYIESLLRDAEDPRIAEALDAPDGLFVKNLENVQGDERDTILFSTGFSKNERGYLPLNFGPLNRSGGERRLNVAVTRARRQVIVFSSFDPSDLRAEETSSLGIKHLRSYLDLAASGTDALPSDGRRKPAVDRHREQIADALRERGLVVATDVGLSDFKVDLSVALPEEPERPLMAILLDSPVWASRGTVGDRDGLPTDVLSRMLRWPSVQRVWLPEWLSDSAAVLDRLEKEIRREDLLAEPEVEVQEPVVVPVPVARPEPAVVKAVPIPPAAPVSNAQPYVPWSYRGTGGIEYLDNLGSSPRARETVRAVLEAIVEAEGPVHTARLAKLVCAEFDLNKVNGQRADSVLKLIDRKKFHVDRDEFVWPTSLDPTTWVAYREADEFEPRKIEHVSLVEIGNAMAELCRDAAGLAPEDLKRQAVRVFGGKRVTAGIGQRLEDALSAALDAGKVSFSGSGLVVAAASRIVTRTTQLDEPAAERREPDGTSTAWTEERSRQVLHLYRQGLMVRDVALNAGLDQHDVATHLINRLLTPEGDIMDETGAYRHGKAYLPAELRRMEDLYRKGESLPTIASDLRRTQLGVGWRLLDEGLPRAGR